MNQLRQTGENLLEAVAYGDAAGLPVETKSAARIAERYGWLNTLIAASDNPFFQDQHEPGTWSDDTELTIAVSLGLLAADGFDLQSQAETHIRAYLQAPKVARKGRLTPRGWGGSTTNSMRRLMAGALPSRSGEAGGSGNGVIMKLSPLSYWQYARGISDEQRYAEYDALTRMTHDSDVAAAATRLHGDVLHYLLTAGMDEDALVDSFAELVLERSVYHERAIGLAGGEVSQALQYLKRPDVSYQPDKILACTDGKGFYVPQTLAMAYGAFYHLGGDFHHTVYEAVNLGGDTDSIASIVAAMVNFVQAGNIELPEDAHLLKDRQRLQHISITLASVALKTITR